MKRLGDRLIESELSAFDDLRESHIKSAQRLEKALSDVQLESYDNLLNALATGEDAVGSR